MNGQSHNVTITVKTLGSGSVSPGGTVETWWDPGATITFTAYPSPGWVFDHWEGFIGGTDNPVTVLIPHNNSVLTAVFILITVPQPDIIYESFTEVDYPAILDGYITYFGNNTVAMTDPFGYLWLSQSFRPRESHTITKIVLPLYGVHLNSGLHYISIQPTVDATAADSGQPIKIPTGTILTNTIMNANLIGIGLSAWMTYTFSRKVWLTKDVDYAIVIQADVNYQNDGIGRTNAISGSLSYPGWGLDNPRYARGQGAYSTDFGVTWNTGAREWGGDPADTYWTMGFAEYGNTVFPLKTMARLAASLVLKAKHVKP